MADRSRVWRYRHIVGRFGGLVADCTFRRHAISLCRLDVAQRDGEPRPEPDAFPCPECASRVLRQARRNTWTPSVRRDLADLRVHLRAAIALRDRAAVGALAPRLNSYGFRILRDLCTDAVGGDYRG